MAQAVSMFYPKEGFFRLPPDVLKYLFIDLDPVSRALVERTCRNFRNIIHSLREENIQVSVKTYSDYCGVSQPREGKRKLIILNTPYIFCLFSATQGSLGILKWFHETQLRGKTVKLWDDQTCYAAAGGGHLQALQWLRQNGCPWNFDKSVCRNAARNGHLHVLQWARPNGARWSESTCDAAARSGHLNVLQWLRQNDCPWDRGACLAAAAGGHLEALQWAIDNGCPWDRCTKEECLEIAERNGHPHIVKWLKDTFPESHYRCQPAAP